MYNCTSVLGSTVLPKISIFHSNGLFLFGLNESGQKTGSKCLNRVRKSFLIRTNLEELIVMPQYLPSEGELRMKYCVLPLVFVFSLTTTETSAQQRRQSADTVAPADELEGTWELVAHIADGRLIDDPPTHLVISGNRWQTRGVIREHFPDLVDMVSEDAKEFMWDQKIRYLENTPGGVDLHRPQRPVQTDQGEDIPSMFGPTKLAIYRIRGEFLDVCEAQAECPRPSMFESTPDSKQILRVYRRMKATRTAQATPGPTLEVGQLSGDESQIESIKVDHGRVTVRNNEITVKGGVVRIRLR